MKKGALSLSLAAAALVAGSALFAFIFFAGQNRQPSQEAIDNRANAETQAYAQRQALALTPQAQRDAAEIARISRADGALDAVMWIGVAGVGIVVIGGALALVRLVWQKGNLVYARGGLFPLVREGGLAGKALIDPNRMAHPATLIHVPGLTRQTRAALSGKAGEGGLVLSAAELAPAGDQMQITTQAQLAQLAATGMVPRGAGRGMGGDSLYSFPAAPQRNAIPPVEVIEVGEHNLSHIQRLLGEPEAEGDGHAL